MSAPLRDHVYIPLVVTTRYRDGVCILGNCCNQVWPIAGGGEDVGEKAARMTRHAPLSRTPATLAECDCGYNYDPSLHHACPDCRGHESDGSASVGYAHCPPAHPCHHLDAEKRQPVGLPPSGVEG